MLEQLRSSPELDIGLDRRQALSLGASAEDAAGALTEDEREEFEEASYDLREFLDEMEPWERRAMLERLGTAILATLSYIERLASQGSAAGGSIALFAAVWSLYLLYALVDRTITAVEERREEDDS